MNPASDENPITENRTARLEAFSDGVFSIAVTLLVFNIAVPRDLPPDKPLIDALLELWPSYFAYLVSFLTIGVMWINHHNLFKIINRTDHTLLVLNVLLMLMVTFVNFPTAVLGAYIKQPDTPTAAGLLSGTYFITAVIYNLLWRYASYNRRLIDDRADQAVVDAITRAYRYGPLMYLVAFLLAFVSTPLSVLCNFGLAVFYALPNTANLFGGD